MILLRRADIWSKSMKRFVQAAVITATIVFAAPAAAVTLTSGTHNLPYEYGGRTTNWDENIESESASVIKSGSHTNFNVSSVPWGQGTWLFSGYVQLTFTVPADTLFIQFQSDTNDGIAQFLVDGTEVGSLNTYNRGWFQVAISDLTLGIHTLRVNRISSDLAFDNFGALNTSEVPLPAALPLFASALIGSGVIAWRKKRKQKAEAVAA